MRLTQRLEYQYRFLYTTLGIGLLGLLSMASCQCGLKPGRKGGILNKGSNLTLSVSNNTLKDGNKHVLVLIKNEEETGTPAIDLKDFKLILTISEQKGGTGSQWMYPVVRNGYVEEKSYVDKVLTEFTTTAALSAQQTEPISLTLVIPDSAVTMLTAKIQLFSLAQDKVIGEETVNWSVTPPPYQLKLINMVPAIKNNVGSFQIHVADSEVKPQDIQVIFDNTDRSAVNTATFLFNNKPVEKISTLADLLGKTDLIPKGTTVGPIPFQLDNSNGQIEATITLLFKKDTEKIGEGTISWSEKASQLALNLSYDKASKQITYTIINTGTPVKDTDTINLKFVSNNKATLNINSQLEREGQIELKAASFLGGTSTGTLAVNLQSEERAEYTFDLLYNTISVVQQTIACTKDVSLEIANIVHIKAGSGLDKKDAIKVDIKNTGSAIANKVTLQYKNTDPENKATIDNKSQDERKNLTIYSNLPTLENIGLLDLKTEKSARFEFTLFHDGVEVAKKIETFAVKDIVLGLKNLRYDSATNQLTYEVTNTGSDPVEEVDQVTLAYEIDPKGTIRWPKKGVIDLKQIPAKESISSQIAIDLQRAQAAQVTLTLKLGNTIVAKEEIPCEEDVQVQFADTHPINLQGGADKYEIQVQNNGTNQAIDRELKIKATRKTGNSATILEGLYQSQGVYLIPLDNLDPASTLEKELTIIPGSDVTATFELQLVYRGKEIKGAKTLSCKKADVSLDFEDSSALTLEGDANTTISFKIKNKGVDQTDPNKVALIVQKLSGNEGVKINGLQLKDDLAKETIDLSVNNIVLAKDEISKLLNLQIDPNKSAEVQFRLQLKYDGVSMGTPKIITWNPAKPAKPVIKLDFDYLKPKDPTKRYPDPLEYIYKLKTNHTVSLDEYKLQLKVTNNSQEQVKANFEEVAKNTFISLPYVCDMNKDGILNVGPLKNTEMSLTIDLVYDGKPMGLNRVITWKNTPKLDIDIAWEGTNSPGSQKMRVTLLNTTGRKLEKAELEQLIVGFGDTLPTGAEIKKNGDEVVGKTLGALGVAQDLADKATLDFIVDLTREENEKKTWEGIILALKDTPDDWVGVTNNISEIAWEAAP